MCLSDLILSFFCSRLVLQQEQNHRHQTQSAITPTEVPQRIINKPKDLTSSLLDSNLSQLKLTHNNSNNNTWFNNNSTNNNFTTSHSATGSLAKSPSNQWGESNNSSKNNWGAFDDLVPSTKAAKVPLNQMTNRSSNQPAPLLMHSTNNNTYNKSIKGNNNLSADDIMEFLK